VLSVPYVKWTLKITNHSVLVAEMNILIWVVSVVPIGNSMTTTENVKIVNHIMVVLSPVMDQIQIKLLVVTKVGKSPPKVIVKKTKP